MKYTSFLLIGLMLLFCPGVISSQTNASSNPPQKSLNIVSSPELHSLAENWASEYSRLNPDLNIKLLNKETASPGDGATIRISGDPAAEGQWKMVVGHDAVVPVFNPDNPMLGEMAEKIKLLPIDKNGNRRIDYFEDIYKTPAGLLISLLLQKHLR